MDDKWFDVYKTSMQYAAIKVENESILRVKNVLNYCVRIMDSSQLIR